MAAQQQPNQSDNSMAIIWIIVAIFVACAVIWYSAKQYIIAAYLKIKLCEIYLLSYFTHRLDDIEQTILITPASQYSLNDIVKIGHAVGDYLRFPLVAIIIGLAIIVYFSSIIRLYKNTYNMYDLLNAEKDNWPQITPIAQANLIKTDIDKGPWAMAMTPMQFCKHHKLLEEYQRQPHEGMTRAEWNRIEVNLKKGEANRLFVMQLGPRWEGINKVPAHVQALLAAFAARVHADSKAAMALFKQISLSSSASLNYSGVLPLLRKYWNTREVQNVANRHAYVLTVLASMLEAARLDGVQSTADFLWLKPIDRRLWYMLNTIGRQTPFVEVAGPYAHWIAEKEVRRGIVVPMIAEATHALELALKEVIYHPDVDT